MALHHNSDLKCPLCEEKLLNAHPLVADWFRRLKGKYINVHISWSFRGQTDQDQFLKDGKTTLAWPKSKHNHMENGIPKSLALDLFLIDEDGIAKWPPLWFAQVNEENEQNQEPMLWAGTWKTFKETDHFELITVKFPV